MNFLLWHYVELNGELHASTALPKGETDTPCIGDC
jgi:hypothetical protein